MDIVGEDIHEEDIAEEDTFDEVDILGEVVADKELVDMDLEAESYKLLIELEVFLKVVDRKVVDHRVVVRKEVVHKVVEQ